MSVVRELSGSVFGYLTVQHRIGSRSGKAVWLCSCVCGAAKEVLSHNLRSGSTTSCGCRRNAQLARRSTTHGMSKHPIYASWHSMRERCDNPKHPCYLAYGGRGITVCEEWRSFSGFLRDMGASYFPGATVDREDMDEGYSLGNCRWLPAEVNRKIKRNCIYVTYRHRRRRLRDLAVSRGLEYSKVYYRYRQGYSVEDCLSLERLR